MSITRDVVGVVKTRGSATLSELAFELPEYTESQIFNAIKNCRTLGLIHCLGRPRKVPGTNCYEHARNYPGRKTRSLVASPFPQAELPPPASVWQLADRPMMEWPPQGVGRKFNPLGAWD